MALPTLIQSPKSIKEKPMFENTTDIENHEIQNQPKFDTYSLLKNNVRF